MNDTDIVRLVESIAEVQTGTVTVDTELESLDWDSLAALSFISAIDSSLGLIVEATSLTRATTVADLVAVVNDAASSE